MFKKKRLFAILLLMFPLLFVAGLSAWIIATTHNIAPSYEADHTLAAYFAEENETTYNKSEQLPEVVDNKFTTTEEKTAFENSLYYSYAEIDESNKLLGDYIAGAKPTNAGRYSVRISFSNSEDDLLKENSLHVKFVINKATPVMTTDVSIIYPSGQTFHTSDSYTNTPSDGLTYTGGFNHYDGESDLGSIEGNINYSDSRSSLTVGNHSYQYTFTPTDTDNYNTYVGNVNINTYAVINFEEVKPYNDNQVATTGKTYAAEGTSFAHLTKPSVTNTFVGYDDPDDTSLFGWSESKTIFDSASDYVVSSDMNLYYLHIPIIYTITYVFDADESFASDAVIRNTYTVLDSSYTLPTPIKNDSDYDFIQWDENGRKVTTINAGTIGDRTFTALFKIPLNVSIPSSTYTYDGETYSSSVSVMYSENGVTHTSTPSGVSFNYVGNSCVNAGTHTIKASINNNDKYYIGNADSSGYVSGTLTINKRPVTISNVIVEVDYNANSRNFAGIQTAVQPKITFEYTNNKSELVSFTLSSGVTLKGMQDGYYYYGDSVGTATTTNVVGSTYRGTVTLSHNNYLLANDASDQVTIKYKTAKIGTSYFTIEDAIRAAGRNTIVLEGVASNENYVMTSFSSLPRSVTGYSDANYNLKGKLRVPFANVDMDYHGSAGMTSINGSTDGCESIAVTSVDAVYSALNIPSTITLNLVSGSSLMVGGLIATSGVVTNRGVIMNSGTIIANADTTIGTYGYIKGTGTVEMLNGSHLTDVFRMFDWSGGGTAAGLNNAKVFPVNSFSIHNVSCDVKVYSGAKYEAFWNVNFANRLYSGFQRGDKNGNVLLLGEGGLFNVTSGYILKQTTESKRDQTAGKNYLLTITESNQIRGQIDVYKIYGPCVDNSVSIDIKASGTSFTMKTDLEMALPVPYFDITIGNDGNGNIGSLVISKSSFKFLPGSKLSIDDGASLSVTEGADLLLYDIASCIADEANRKSGDGKNTYSFITSSGGYCIDRNDAYLKNNGVLTVDSSSSVGGIVYTDASTGNMNIEGSASTNIKYIDTYGESSFLGFSIMDEYTTKTDRTVALKYHAYNESTGTVSSSFTNASSGTVYFAKSGGWIVSPKYTIQFNGNGGTVVNEELHYQIAASSTITLEELDVADPYRPYYSFTGWYIDENCTTSYVGTTVSTGQTITLYAGWEQIDYTVNFEIAYDVGGNYSYTEKVTFDVNTSTITLPTPSVNGYNFYGWYSVSSYNEDYYIGSGNISFENIIRRFGPGETTITLYGFISEDNYYLITYDTVSSEYDSGISITSERINSKNASSYVIPDHANQEIVVYDKDIYVEYAFGGWYLDEECTIPFDSSKITGDTVIYAKWSPKLSITYDFEVDGVENATYYYVYGSGVTITGITPAKPGHTFASWNTLANGTGTKYTEITDTTFNKNTTVYAQYEPNIYKLTIQGNSGERAAVITFTDANGKSQSISIGSSNSTVYTFDVKFGTTITVKAESYGIRGTGTKVNAVGGGMSNSYSNGMFTSINKSFTIPIGDVILTVSSA